MKKDRESRLLERLQLNQFKLQSLLGITKGINDNLPIEELLSIYQQIVREELGIESLLLFSKSKNGWMPLLQYGAQVDIMQIAPHELSARYPEITVLTTKDDSAVSSYDVLIPVHHKDTPLAILLIGDLDVDDEVMKMSPTIKHMNFIQTLTNVMVVAVENKRLMKESIEQAKLKRDIELAADIQNMLVPSTLPNDEFSEVGAVYIPNRGVGGDYYDYMRTDDGQHYFCIADVSGKGVAAAFLMSNFQARMRSLIENGKSLKEIVQQLNRGVNDAVQGDKYITLFLGKFDEGTRMLEYINAGHNLQLLVQNDKAQWMDRGCVGVGMFDEIPAIESVQMRLEHSALLVTFTDGLVEMENKENEEYGYDRLTNLVLSIKNDPVQDINKKLMGDFDEFRQELPPFDDIALLTIRFW